MNTKRKIPVHRMDDWFSGIYIKPFARQGQAALAYDLSLPHRHDFYYCVLLDKGSMQIGVDFDIVALGDRSLFLSYPGQVHKIIKGEMERGWFIAFDPSRLDGQVVEVLDQCLSEIILLNLTEEQCADLFTSIRQLYDLYNGQNQLFQQAIIHSSVTALLYRIVSAYLSVEKLGLVNHSSRSVGISRQFKQLLRREYRKLRKPSDFAARMNISVSHLNDSVRAITGNSVTHAIQAEVMREARRLLYHSGLSLKEIADDLGFEDVRYFNRLFRKVVGMSALDFRCRVNS